MCSALAYAGVVAWASARERALAPVVATIGGLGAVLLLFGLVRGHAELLGWALAAGALAYALALLVHGAEVDEGAPLVATGLLLCGELAAWSLDERFHVTRARGLLMARALGVGVLALVGLGAAALVVALAAAPVGHGLAWTVAGAAAAVGAIAVAARLSRS
jgi:hypothetical protein